MSGTLINSRQEEIIHKLQKKVSAKQTIFSGDATTAHGEKKIHTTKLRERRKKVS